MSDAADGSGNGQSSSSNVEKTLKELRDKVEHIYTKLEKPSFWNSNTPLIIAIIAAAVGAFGNILVSCVDSDSKLGLERQKLQHDLLKNAVQGPDLDRAKSNLKFLLKTKLLKAPAVDAKAMSKYLFQDDGDPLIIVPETRAMPSRTNSFNLTKKILTSIHTEIGHLETLYCGCPYKIAGSSGGEINRTACELKARRNVQRASRVEWEHVVPASWIGRKRECWVRGDQLCVDANGSSYRGRRCCAKKGVDPEFVAAYTDMHNLFPVVGEINADRSNHSFGEVTGEDRKYGKCDFEVGERPRVAEPAKSVRGEVARAMLYMMNTYSVDVGMTEEELRAWHEADLPESWEVERAALIEAESGRRNRYLDPERAAE